MKIKTGIEQEILDIINSYIGSSEGVTVNEIELIAKEIFDLTEHSKPDEYDMVLRREDGLHITLDIVNLTVTTSGVKQFTLVIGETK